jgi:hypothetical protein
MKTIGRFDRFCLRALLCCVLACAGLFLSVMRCQAAPDVESHANWWIPVVLEVPITERVHLNVLSENIILDNFQDNAVYQLAPKLNITLNKNLDIGAGYNYISYLRGPVRTQVLTENRLSQYVTLKHPMKHVTLETRLMLEEQFITWLNRATAQGRWLVGARAPLGKSHFFAFASNEIVVGFGQAGPLFPTGVRQNRLVAGLGCHVSKHIDVELAYMLFYLQVANNTPDLLDHALVTSLKVTLPTPWLDEHHVRPREHRTPATLRPGI